MENHLQYLQLANLDDDRMVAKIMEECVIEAVGNEHSFKYYENIKKIELAFMTISKIKTPLILLFINIVCWTCIKKRSFSNDALSR